jgi:hypothetical protein
MASDPFDFSDVLRTIENEIDEIMGDPVSATVLQLSAVKFVEQNVYPYYGNSARTEENGGKDPFKSRKYIRRLDDGGLADPSNYEVMKDRMKLTLINNTHGNERQPGESWTSGPINDIIEEGVGYGWRHSDIYMDQPAPRPFMQDAIDYFVEDYLIPLIEAKCFVFRAGGGR